LGIRTLALTAVAAAAVLFGTATPASAAPATGTPFARQAAAAHLSPAQTRAVQAKVDGYLAKVGGRQVALNEIAFDGGRLRVTLPGEAQPRDFATGTGQRTANPCSSVSYNGWFCAYSGTYYTGDQLNWYSCTSYIMPWSTTGSWKNNQSSGTRARFYSSTGALYYTTPGAYSSNVSYGWRPIYTVRPC
jgi:hypothetical protein